MLLTRAASFVALMHATLADAQLRGAFGSELSGSFSHEAALGAPAAAAARANDSAVPRPVKLAAATRGRMSVRQPHAPPGLKPPTGIGVCAMVATTATGVEGGCEGVGCCGAA